MPAQFLPASHIRPPALASVFRKHPTRLFVEASSRCNQNCVVCVTQNQGNTTIHGDGDMELATFEAIKEVFPRLDALVLNGTGEPLLNHHLEMFISQAKKNMSGQGWVGFQTNGNLLSNLRALALVDAGLDRICLTMDGESLTAFESIRASGQLIDLDLAFSAIVSSKAICSRPDLQVGVEFVVTIDNMHELPGAVSWAAARGATFAIVSDLCRFAEKDSAQCHAGICADNAFSHFNAWKSRADDAGVNIDRYFELLWKHGRTFEEQRIVNFVESMRSIARYRGVELSNRPSSAPEYAISNEIAEAFGRAESVARAAGIDLRIPKTDGQGRGDCTSIEQGAAFISWDGRMYPGYHLRNRCRSCADDWLHPLQPATFGNVLKRGLLDIWNSKEFGSCRSKFFGLENESCFGTGISRTEGAGYGGSGQHGNFRSEPCGGCWRSSGSFRCME